MHNSNRYRRDFFFLLFATFAMAIVGDNATEALVLSRYSSDLMSRMFSINAIILFLFSLFSMQLVDKFNRAKLYQAFLVLYAVIIFAAWAFSQYQSSWIYIPLYSLGYSGKILSFFFVWTMANDISDARKGLRDFPIIASGGTLGAIITTFLIPQIVKVVTPAQLLLVWLIPLVITLVIANRISRRYRRNFARKKEGRRRVTISPKALIANLSILRKESLLRGMSIGYFLIFFLVFNQQYLFYTVLKEKLGDAVEISRFLGYFTGISLLATFILQLFVAGKITRKLGVIRTLYLLPVAMILAFAGILISSASTGVLIFEMVIAGLALRIAFFDSFFSPSYQNFFSSLPAHLRGNSKLAIDGIVKPLAMVTSTVWIFLVKPSLSSYIILTTVAIVALIMMMMLKKRYIATLVKYLTRYRNNSAHSIQEEAEMFNSVDGLRQLEKILDDNLYEVQRFAVDLLVLIDSEKSIELLMKGFYKRNGELQAYIATAIARSKRSEVVAFLHDVLSLSPFPRVVANTIWSLGDMGRADIERVVAFVKSETPRIRGNCIVILSRSGALSGDELELQLRAMLFHQSENIQATGLWAISQVPFSESLQNDSYQYWYDHSERIVHNIYLWRQFLAVVRSLGSITLLTKMLHFYDSVDELKQQVLLQGLIDYGRKHGIESLIMLENDTRGEARGVIIEAIARCDYTLTHEQVDRVGTFAQQEYRNAVIARNITDTLHKNSEPELMLFRDIVLEQELCLHVRNLFNCALMLDRSGKLRTIHSNFVDREGVINSQVTEILDTIRSNKVNRFLVNFAEEKSRGRKQMTMRDIIHNLSKSSSRQVKDYIEYLKVKGLDGR